MSGEPSYKRLLLKISGESLMGEQGFGIDPAMVSQVARDIKSAVDMGFEIGVVIGGGNIFRGVTLAAQEANRVTSDHMGMLATTMNALALQMAIEKTGVDCVAMSAVEMPGIIESFNQRALDAYMASGLVVVFSGGTGSPFFTTDTAAALRALEIEADVLLKATQVDGIYSADPKKFPQAERFERISHREIIEKGLEVMDATAISLTHENNIPVVVFSIHTPGALIDVLSGKGHYTIVER